MEGSGGLSRYEVIEEQSPKLNSNGRSLVLKLGNGLAFYIYHTSGFKYTLHTAYTHRKYCNITYVSEENLKSTRMLTILLFAGEKEKLQKCSSPVHLLKGMLAMDVRGFQPLVS